MTSERGGSKGVKTMKTYLQKRNSGDVFDMFEDFFKPMFYDEQLDSMRTDIKETDKDYQLSIEMPGYLTVSAEKNEQQEEGSENAKYLRKECRVSCQRSYYVGDQVQEEAVKAKYENGMLLLSVPKEEPKKLAAKSIAIE